MKTNKARASIASVVLINFNGIQFEHLEFDVATTSLEGRNGAGKTTTMIGAYLPLMPDQAYLKFKNVSDNGDQTRTDQGIYDRLGTYSDTSYSVMEFRLSDGSTIFAGVEIQKRPLRKYELTTFVIREVPKGLLPEDLLMVRDADGQHCIAPLSQLAPHIVSLGAHIEKFRSLTDYFHALFELGVSPTLMTTSLDRSKFHKLMMSSFYGGLTGDLQKSIKDYLLPEHHDVATAVEKAREHLNEVRVTKHNIDRAQDIYGKILKVDRRAFAMMATAYYAVANQYESSRRELRKAREAYRAGKEEYRQATAELERLKTSLAETQALIQKTEIALEAAVLQHGKVQAAHALAQKIDALRPQVQTLQQKLEAADQAFKMAGVAETDARRHYDVLLEQQRTLAKSLGDARAAFENISREVGLYRAACRAMNEAQKALAGDEMKDVLPEGLALGQGNIDLVRQLVEKALRQARADLEPKRRGLQNAEDVENAFKPVYAALQELRGVPVDYEAAYSTGHQMLAHYRDLAAAVLAAQGIEDRIRKAAENAKRQETVRGHLAKLRDERKIAIQTADELRACIAATNHDLDTVEKGIERGQQQLFDFRQDLTVRQSELEKGQARLVGWASAANLGQQYVDTGGNPLSNPATWQQEDERLEGEAEAASRTIVQVEAQIDALDRRISELEDNGSRLDERLSVHADKVGGRLVSEVYDEVEQENAGRLQARMGPLIEAIMVPNVQRAAATLANDPQPPDGVWLVQEDQLAELPEGEFIGNTCLVEMGAATRLSLIPTHPILGRAARLAEINRLQTQKDGLIIRLNETKVILKNIRRLRRILTDLKVYKDWLGLPSPQPEITAAEEAMAQVKQNIDGAEQRLKAARVQVANLKSTHAALNDCNINAAFIGGEDWGATSENLREQKRVADKAQRQIKDNDTLLSCLQKGLENLRAIPLSEAKKAQLATECETLEARISQCNDARDKLIDLQDKSSYFLYESKVALEEQERGALQHLADQEKELVQLIQTASETMAAKEGERRAADEAVSQARSDWRLANDELAKQKLQLDEMECPSDAGSMTLAKEAVDTAQAELTDLVEKHKAMLVKSGSAETKCQTVQTALAGAGNSDSRLAQARQATRNYVRGTHEWRDLVANIQQEDKQLLARLQTPDVAGEYQQQSWVSLRTSINNARAQLVEVLEEAGAPAVLGSAQREPGRDVLGDWLGVRYYLDQSLPRDITQSDNVPQALTEITEALHDMHERLKEQEVRFRTSAESIAKSIANRVQREIRNITRINDDKNLAGVRFGSITGVCIEAQRVEHMVRFLDALRCEQDLFNDDRPLEEALAWVYERSGGGSVKGMQLLDYRNYIQIRIKVQRLGNSGWDKNIGTSSGEAIGVGAAILVVILDAMERQAEALQRRRIKGSFRFLMLDEANRLDSDSLEMMAGFCQSMGVQLLVAAPEIAKARSGTTYCFVRRESEHGQEVEVTYRGRRGFATQVDA